jgi:hypothetical protein
MTATGHLSPLPRRSIAVRFAPVSGIDSRSQALPSRATSGPSASQQNDLYSITSVGAAAQGPVVFRFLALEDASGSGHVVGYVGTIEPLDLVWTAALIVCGVVLLAI